MSHHYDESKDPSLKKLTVLGLSVLIPILVLLLIWARKPDPVPSSRNIYLSN